MRSRLRVEVRVRVTVRVRIGHKLDGLVSIHLAVVTVKLIMRSHTLADDFCCCPVCAVSLVCPRWLAALLRSTACVCVVSSPSQRSDRDPARLPRLARPCARRSVIVCVSV